VATGAMFSEERRSRILELIRARKKVTVHELCQLLEVSPATVRGDLRDLDREGLLVRTHGGALEKSQTGYEPICSQRSANLTAKRAIAVAARRYVADGDTILLDTGTTTLELAQQLTPMQQLRVVTNDLEIARVLEGVSGVEVVLLGGTLRQGYHCTVGPTGVRALADLRVDSAFLATNSLSVEAGATTPDLQQAETKRAMCAIAGKVIMLCDSSKLGRASFARFADPSQIDILVTERMSEADGAAWQEQGVEVVLAAPLGNA
jgi:DeoR family transcriptional regulator, fructose operon transcriptional repressor